MANPKVFFDANVLLYTDDPRYPAKQKRASDLVEKHLLEKTGVISLQVLGEYFHNARRRMKLPVPVVHRRTIFFSNLLRFQPVLGDVFDAIDLHERHQFAYWDAMIVRAAIKSGCRILYSEDMQHGRRVENVEIVNPFL